MDVDLETSEALYEKLLQMESEVRKTLGEKQKKSQRALGSSWHNSGMGNGEYFVPVCTGSIRTLTVTHSAALHNMQAWIQSYSNAISTESLISCFHL